jgi:tetratricopeptide (TPR) repeat protein
MSMEMELIRWLAIVAAAIAFLVAVASVVAAADPATEPKLLPDDMGTVAKPIPPQIAHPFFPEDPPVRQLPPAEAAARLWMTLENQAAGRIVEALSGWQQIRLPEETAHWREIALGAAYLRAGDLERAAMHFEAGRQQAPNHAVVAYFTGILQLEQAAAIGRVPDGVKGKALLLVSTTPLEDKALYQLLAMVELRHAIAEADEIRLDERLLVADPQVEEVVILPRVGDLLKALGAENFAGKAHHVLFGLHLDQGELASAEFHLERAAATGLAVLYGYRDLAAAYLDQGQNADAIRLALKDLDINQPWLGKLSGRLTETVQAISDKIWVW